MTNPIEVFTDETQKTQADPETAERFIAEKRIGERIRRLRLKKSMGLVELGKHTGLSASFLSQLETGRVVPTLRNLARIAMVFSKDLSYFFDTEPTAMFRIHRQKDRVRLPQTGVEPPTYFLATWFRTGTWTRILPSSFLWRERRIPRRICTRDSSFFTFSTESWSFATETRSAFSMPETPLTLTRGRRTPTSVRGRRQPE
jgi:transcriptional regulator with XRE-family HTH domain